MKKIISANDLSAAHQAEAAAMFGALAKKYDHQTVLCGVQVNNMKGLMEALLEEVQDPQRREELRVFAEEIINDVLLVLAGFSGVKPSDAIAVSNAGLELGALVESDDQVSLEKHCHDALKVIDKARVV